MYFTSKNFILFIEGKVFLKGELFMALRTIRIDGDPILRKKAKKVERVDGNIQNLLKDMADTMYQNDGIGLAGNQVGILKRLVVADDDDMLLMLVNPTIISKEGEVCKEEGCLSVPEMYGDVVRAEKIEVKALDEKGRRLHFKASGMLARILQHEIDHLDGKLFTDFATDVGKRHSDETKEEEQEEAK